MDTTIYLLTSDKTYYILNLSLYMWKKFLPNNSSIKVLGFNKGKEICDNYNVDFISLGQSQDINMFTKYIYDYLKNIPDEFIILSLDDFFPINPIKLNLLSQVKQKMVNNHNLVKCVLNSSYYLIDDDSIIDNVTCNNSDLYKLSLQISLWNVKYLLKYLSIGLSPWDFELYEPKDTDNYVIKISNIKKSDVFSDNKLEDKTPFYIIQTNPSSHLSSPYEYINVLGLSFDLINECIEKKILKEDELCFGFDSKQNKKILYRDCKDENSLINQLKNVNYYYFREYYYLYNNIYKFS